MAPKVKTKSAQVGSKGGLQSPGKGPAEPAGPSLDELCTSLDRHVKASEFKQIVEVADQSILIKEIGIVNISCSRVLIQIDNDSSVLALAPKDLEATECKVVALIQLDLFDKALLMIEEVQNPGVSLGFHKAYCLYKSNLLPDALQALQISERTASNLELEAQIFFKMGDFAACIRSYEALLLNHKVESNEVKSNILAAYISGGRSHEVPALMDTLKVSPRSNFNLAYNSACALTEKGDFSKAEEHLLLARRIGQETLIEEDCKEDEVEDELAPITVQLAYVKQAQGLIAEAMEGYNALLKRKRADLSSMAVASNNLVVLRGTREIFDALKRFDKLTERKGGHGLQFISSLEHRLSDKQKEAMCVNQFLMLLHSNKLNQAHALVVSLMDNFSASVVPHILSASLFVKAGKHGSAEDLLLQYADQHPDNSATALIVCAQIASSAGNFTRAAESLQRISELQHKPGMVATLVALKERSGDIKGAESILDAAVNWWENKGTDAKTLEVLIQEAACFKLKHQNLKAAAELFERLTNSSSSVVRLEALHGLVSSTAYSDPARAASYEKQLPPLPGLKVVDVEALEHAAPTAVSYKRGRAGEDATGQSKTGEDKVYKIKKKRKRKPLYPKNFDPANPGPPPDPERWIPKRERSTFRPRKKDKRTAHAQIRGAQGSVARERSGDSIGSGGSGLGTSGKSSTGSISNLSKAATSVAGGSEVTKVPTSQKSKKKGRR